MACTAHAALAQPCSLFQRPLACPCSRKFSGNMAGQRLWFKCHMVERGTDVCMQGGGSLHAQWQPGLQDAHNCALGPESIAHSTAQGTACRLSSILLDKRDPRPAGAPTGHDHAPLQLTTLTVHTCTRCPPYETTPRPHLLLLPLSPCRVPAVPTGEHQRQAL